ncbi:CHASE2 domain-containing protein [Candidatus Kryptobacter tengchongensis]|nr:CHASE2 domain-containing protein [Candidatus Kryptobacter tengchongensis]
MKVQHKLLIAFLISFLIFIVELAKLQPFESLNSLFNELKFRLRGQSQVDTSLIFLYIDDNAIYSLGGYPLKRSYYALLIDLLTQLNVKAIALDILLTERNSDYPERDELLALTIKNSNRVYLGGSFANLKRSDKDTSNYSKLIEKFLIKANEKNPNFIKGSNFLAPFDELLNSCAGLGHLNYIQLNFPKEIPLIIQIDENRYLPSLSLELSRIYYNIPRDSVKILKNEIYLGRMKIPTKDGKILINYIAGTKGLKMYPVLDFVRSYDAIKSGLEPEINLSEFKDKIVFIGIFSEALGQVVNTPFQDKFPPTGIHLMALNTIIRGKFLTETTSTLNFILSFVFSLLILHLTLMKNISNIIKLLVFPSLVILIFLLFSLALFVIDISIPAYPAFAILFSSLLGVIYTFEIERKKMIEIESQRAKIEEMIKEKELKIIELQQKLESLKLMEEKSSLISNLEKTYDEVKELTSKFEDFSDFNINYEINGAELEGIVYSKGGKMEEIISTVQKVAPSDAPVLITGESGAGKELIAMAIHKLSERKDKKFVTINCSAVPETLLESELFGYEKGAFTGATQRKKGLFEIADGGTIFLDEIAETSLSFQTKILRILQSGEFNRVGGTEVLKVNVRIIAATNRDIEKAIREGKFREDLYYRLNVIRIHIPPLRERKEDIPFLVEHFLRKFKSGDIKVSHAVMIAFLNYDWPGNIRQLENAIKRAIIFARSDGRKLIQLKDLPEEIAKSAKGKIDIEEKILNSLREKKFSHSSISETANELGLNRGTIGEYLRGICFRNLYECKFDITKASLKIAGDDPDVSERVKKKLIDYIKNLIENIAQCKSEDEIKSLIKQKYKNLPLRYHPYLEEFAIRFQKGELTMEKLNLNGGDT